MKYHFHFFITLVFFGSLLAKDVSAIKIKDVDGKMFTMADHLDNDAIIILFWATWCLPCQKEFPAIQNLIDKYPDKKVKVLAISKDTPRSLAKVKSFIRKHDYDFTWLMDSDGSVSANYMVDVIPHSILADASGKIVYTHTGYRIGDELELEKELLQLWQE
ncbi:TlpA family protein disulfide reductase [candidate division KSB1 bacterium]|nr:TlpA family protein disulfide reductase [candidate division KSB1 bacterium]RQW05676.1 MAG: TlpA family protein disulfide reductase [candidate division KSB1 bacterium]